MIVNEEPEECVLLIEELDFSSVSAEQISHCTGCDRFDRLYTPQWN